MKKLFVLFFLFCSAKIFSQVPQYSLYEFINGVALPKATPSTYKLNKAGSIFYNTLDSSLSYSTGSRLLRPARIWGDLYSYLNNQIDLNAGLTKKVDITGRYGDPAWITSLDSSKIPYLAQELKAKVTLATQQNITALKIFDEGLIVPHGKAVKFIAVGNGDTSSMIYRSGSAGAKEIRFLADSSAGKGFIITNTKLSPTGVPFLQAFITKTSGATTLDVSTGNLVNFNDTTSTSFTQFTGGQAGQLVVCYFTSGTLTTFVNSSNLFLGNGIVSLTPVATRRPYIFYMSSATRAVLVTADLIESTGGVGTSGQILTSNGTSSLPTWQTGSVTINNTAVNLGGSVDTRPVSASLTSDDTTTSASSVNATGLSVPVLANRSYIATVTLWTSCGSTGGLKILFSAPAGTVILSGNAHGSSTAAATSQITRITAPGVLPGTAYNRYASGGQITMIFEFTTSSAGGTVQIKFASATAGQLSTIETGSTMVLQEIQTPTS